MTETEFRYRRLTREIADKIHTGIFRAGEKLPSLRQMQMTSGFSMATVYQAYVELEKQGLVEARERSGFFVTPARMQKTPPPDQPRTPGIPQPVSVNALARTLVTAMGDPAVIQFGGAAPSETLLPLKALSRILRGIPADAMGNLLKTYENPAGNPKLRAGIARRMMGGKTPMSADDLVITNGCMEALSLSLQAVARSGDTIAVEHPAFHGLLQLIQDLGMNALELPTDTATGVEIDALPEILRAHEIRAVVLTPNFQNPLGFVMPDAHKEEAVRLFREYGIPVIEDDVYGDLHFGPHRPSPLKRFDTTGNVLYCASFSKTIAPGLRIGWVAGGKYHDSIARLKMNRHVAGPGLSQEVTAAYLETGGFDRHLRRMRGLLEQQMMRMIQAVCTHFPEGIRMSRPTGGMILWVQLPDNVDALALFHAAARHRIVILPGHLCSGSNQYTSCIRMNCGDIWSREKDQAVKILGNLIREQMAA